MNEKIWYCTEDGAIFPNQSMALKGYCDWLKENSINGEKDFDIEIFNECYKEITFEEYNKLFT